MYFRINEDWGIAMRKIRSEKTVRMIIVRLSNRKRTGRDKPASFFCAPPAGREPAVINRQASFARRAVFPQKMETPQSSRNKAPKDGLLRLLVAEGGGARKKLAGLSCPVLLANGWRSTKLSEKLYRNRCPCLLNPLKMRLFNRFINSLPKQNESQK